MPELHYTYSLRESSYHFANRIVQSMSHMYYQRRRQLLGLATAGAQQFQQNGRKNAVGLTIAMDVPSAPVKTVFFLLNSICSTRVHFTSPAIS